MVEEDGEGFMEEQLAKLRVKATKKQGVTGVQRGHVVWRSFVKNAESLQLNPLRYGESILHQRFLLPSTFISTCGASSLEVHTAFPL